MAEPATLPRPPGPPPRQPRQPLSDSFEYAPRPDSVPTARLRTRLILAEWELGELADDTESVLAELLANAVETHQRERLSAPVRVTLLGGLRTILVVVRDASGAAPSPASPADDDESGRGLLIVDALAARWDTKPCPLGGKIVRALLRAQRLQPSHNHGKGNIMTSSTPASSTPVGGAPDRDSFDRHDRVFLEKLRLAATVILDLAEDDGVINSALEAELHLFRDRVDRALLLPASSAAA